MITSSPGPMPSAIIAASSASVPDDTAMASRTPSVLGELALERLDLGTHDEALAVADPGDRGENLVAEGTVLRLQIEERNRGPGRRAHRTTISGAPHTARSLRMSPLPPARCR